MAWSICQLLVKIARCSTGKRTKPIDIIYGQKTYLYIYTYTHTHIYILYKFPVQGGKCFSNWWGTCAQRCCTKSINPSPPGYTHGRNLKKGVPKMILPVEMLPKMSFLLDSILNLGGVLPVQNEFYHEFTMIFYGCHTSSSFWSCGHIISLPNSDATFQLPIDQQVTRIGTRKSHVRVTADVLTFLRLRGNWT
jgi:hypothetical protein